MINRRLVWSVESASSEAGRIRYFRTKEHLDTISESLRVLKVRPPELGRKLARELPGNLPEEKRQAIAKNLALRVQFESLNSIPIEALRCEDSMRTHRRRLTASDVRHIQRKVFVRDLARCAYLGAAGTMALSIGQCAKPDTLQSSEVPKTVGLALVVTALIIAINAYFKGKRSIRDEVRESEGRIRKVLERSLAEAKQRKKELMAELEGKEFNPPRDY